MTTPLLPIRELPWVGESLTGFVRRHVRALHYGGLRQLLNLVENMTWPSSLDGLTLGTARNALAALVGRDPEILHKMTVHRWAETLVLRSHRTAAPTECDSKTVLRYFQTARPRVCPACLAENPERDRLMWLFRPLGACVAHGIVLLDRCPGCRRKFLPTRLELERCRCGYRLLDAPSVQVCGRAVALTRQLVDWLDGAHFASIDAPPHVGFWWLDRLRSAVQCVPAWSDRLRGEWNLPEGLDPETIAWLAAATMVVDGEAAMAEFLGVYQAVDKHRSSATGVGRSFGTLLRNAAHLEHLGYALPARYLRNYLLEHFDRGHLTGKVILFRSARQRARLADRPWLDQTTAARLLGVRTPTIQRLVERGALVGRITPAGRRGRTSGVVARDSVAALRRNFARQLSTVEVGEQLGVERHRVSDLIRAGILREVLRTTEGWRLSQACVRQFLERFRKLPPLPVDRTGWLSLRETTRRYGRNGVNLVLLVEHILSGRLAARRDPDVETLIGVYCELGAARRLAHDARTKSESDAGYPLNRLARLLVPGRPLKETVLKKWIDAGLLSARRRRKAWLVTTAEVERFRATYCLAPEACALLKIRRTTLTRRVAEGRIAPIYGRRTHPGAGASVFLRADVRRLAERAA